MYGDDGYIENKMVMTVMMMIRIKEEILFQFLSHVLNASLLWQVEGQGAT